MSKHRVTRGFAWNYLYKIMEYGGLTLYSILVVRKFGPEVGGSYAVYFSISGTLAILTAFAVDGVLLRYLPRIARGESQYGDKMIEGIRPFLLELFAFRLLVTLVISLLVAMMFGVFPQFVPGFATALGTLQRLWPYFIVYLFGQACTSFATFTLLGLMQVRWVFFASAITRVAMIAIGFLLIATNALTLDHAVAVHALAAFLNGGLLLFWTYREVERPMSRGFRQELRAFIRHVATFVGKPSAVRVFVLMPFMLYGITTWGSDVLTTIMGRQPDILMMRAIQGENAPDIGLYESAARLVLMTEYIFLFGFGGTLVSVFSELVHKDEEARDGTTTLPFPRLSRARRDISGFQVVSTAPLFLFMIANAPLAVEAIYGPKFMHAVPMVIAGLSILSVTVVWFAGGMQITSLVVIGKERVVFKNRMTWAVLNVITNYFLIVNFGGLGAMIGTQLANAGAVITEGYFARKWIGSSSEFGRTITIALLAGTAVASGYAITALTLSAAPALVRFIANGLMTAAITLALYALFRIPEAKKVFDRLRGLVAPG